MCAIPQLVYNEILDVFIALKIFYLRLRKTNPDDSRQNRRWEEGRGWVLSLDGKPVEHKDKQTFLRWITGV